MVRSSLPLKVGFRPYDIIKYVLYFAMKMPEYIKLVTYKIYWFILIRPKDTIQNNGK
jgi:hypothetical protein